MILLLSPEETGDRHRYPVDAAALLDRTEGLLGIPPKETEGVMRGTYRGFGHSRAAEATGELWLRMPVELSIERKRTLQHLCLMAGGQVSKQHVE